MIKKMCNIISNIFYFLILVSILFVLIGFVLGFKPYITMSGSMEPNIHTGSVCIVDTKARYEDIQVKDVISYRKSNGTLVTHRVIAITEEGMETKGDNNDISDGISTTEENFHGKTLFSIPYAGYALKWLQQPQNIAIVVVIIVAVILLGVVDDMMEKKEKEKNEK